MGPYCACLLAMMGRDSKVDRLSPSVIECHQADCMVLTGTGYILLTILLEFSLGCNIMCKKGFQTPQHSSDGARFRCGRHAADTDRLWWILCS